MATKQTQLPEKSIETLLAEANAEPLGLNKRLIGEDTLAKLDSMTKPELIALINRVAGAIWGIALQTPEEIAEAMKLKLANGGLTERDMFKALPLMREWFDRQMGKAAQSVALTVKDEGLGKLQDTRLLRLERELARMTGEQAIMIAPEPKRLQD